MARQRRRRGIELGWFETVILLVGYVTSVGIVGATGIYIGQRAMKQRLGDEERLVRLPVSVSGMAQKHERPADEPPLTFYEELGKTEVPAGSAEPGAGTEKPGEDVTKAAQTVEPRMVAGGKAPAAAKKPAGAPVLARTKGPSGAKKPAGAKALGGAKALATPKTPGATKVLAGGKKLAATQMLGALVQGAERIVPPQRSVEAKARKPGLAPRAAAEKRHDEPTTQRLGPGSGPSGVGAVPGRATPHVPHGVTPEAAATARALATGDAGERRQARATGSERVPRSTSLNPARGVTAQAAATARAAPLPKGGPPSSGRWSVQVNATKERALAESLVRRLGEHGYDAFIVEQTRAGSVWYRVRVGRLESLEAANALVSDLKRREGISRAFVASD